MPLHSPPQQPLARGELPPPVVAWLHPLELLRTAYHAWLSSVATAYIDRREVLAALDIQPPGLAELRSARSSTPSPVSVTTDTSPSDGLPVSDERSARAPFFDLERYQTEGVWIDFVADLGDSWEATHAIAQLLAKRELRPRGLDKALPPLPYADLVVLGGDLVYPSPTRDSYRRRTREPIGSALPQAEEKPKDPKILAPRERRLVAIPGNHDWYDGLTSFVREFCQSGWLGGWRLVQMRSYFAEKLMPGWWVWGIDIALDTRIDPAQQNFFLDILKSRSPVHERFDPGDNIILCTAKPSWLKTSRYSDDAYRNLAFFVRGIIEKHEGCVPAILSGDLHHYSRYESAAGYQLITAGSGGSFLMGTHNLPDEVPPFESGPSQPSQTDNSPGYVRAGFPYPSQRDSRRLALGALRLAFRRANIPFCVTVGLISWWLVRQVNHVFPDLSPHPSSQMLAAPSWDFDVSAILSTLLIVAGCAMFARLANSRSSRLGTTVWGAAHGLAHLALVVVIAWAILPHPLQRLGAGPWPYIEFGKSFVDVAEWLSTVADVAVIVLVGGWAGATLVGVYLTVSDRVFGWHENEVFAAQSIIDYRAFLRIHVQPNGEMKIYPIGLRFVPRTWRARLARSKTDPHYEPVDGILAPHLIEGPIDVKAQGGWLAAPAAPAAVAPSAKS